jgi:hypothetical protein
MIRPPHRSVTRFFIPMIDVLTLLFCMFLLLPIFRENETLGEPESTSEAKSTEANLKELERQEKVLDELFGRQQRAKDILAELEKKKGELLQRNLYVRVIDVDPRDGTLSFFDPLDSGKPPRKIANEAAARELIAQHKKEAGERTVYYVFQWTFDPTINYDIAPPVPEQRKQYRVWFREISYTGVFTPAEKHEK